MDSVLRPAAMFLVLLALFRLLGKRSLAQVTTFDLLILLIVSEASQQALIGNDFSVTNAAIVVMTLLMLSRGFDALSFEFPRLGRWLNDAPVILIDDGRPLEDRLRRTRVSRGELLERARELQGLERLEQIKYAVLERDGRISIIPKP